MRFLRSSQVILSLFFTSNPFLMVSGPLCTRWKEGWQGGKRKLPSFVVRQCGEHLAPWGIFVQLFREALPRLHWTDNDETSIPVAFNHFLTVPAQWLVFYSSFLVPGLAETGEKKMLLVWVALNFTFNSPLMCNLKSYSEKNCVHVCGKKECRKVTDVRWEKSQPLIILLSKQLWIALWRKRFPRRFWKTRDSFSCPLQIPYPDGLNSALDTKLLNPSSLLQSTPVYTFTLWKNWISALTGSRLWWLSLHIILTDRKTTFGKPQWRRDLSSFAIGPVVFHKEAKS